MKKTAGYSINPADNTITLTKAYAKLASEKKCLGIEPE